MEHFIRSCKVFWRSERLLKQNDFRLATQKITLHALAGFVALIGLAMLSLSLFFALVPSMGQSLATLAVCGVDFALVGILMGYAKTLKPAPEIELVREMRDMALASMEEEISHAEKEFKSFKKDVQKIVKNPADVLLPMAAGPLLNAAVRGLKATRKQADNGKQESEGEGESESEEQVS